MTDLERAQTKMAKMLEVFHNICKKYHIKYWCSSGTLVGAVRHSGFVPWDGDIDVGMLSEHYNILEKHIQNELPPTMWFFGKTNAGLSKIRDLYSCYTDAANKKDNKHHGLQIDIFIYNVTEENGKKQIKAINYAALQRYKEHIYDYNDIFPVKTTKFADFNVNIPNEIEKICIFTFGAYPPPLPPESKRICHEGKIDPINPAPYFLTVYKEIYKKKKLQKLLGDLTKYLGIVS